MSTVDLKAAREFYGSVFDWDLDPHAGSDSAAIFTLADEIICGAHTAGEGEFGAWSTWFAVDNCDKSASLVSELGGSVHVPPNDMGFGRGAVVADPQGAVFGIGTMNAAAQATAS